MVIVPALVAGYFAMQERMGAILVRHHPAQYRARCGFAESTCCICASSFRWRCAFCSSGAAWIARRAPDEARGRSIRAGLFLLAGFYFTGLYTFWTLLTRQDFLPFYPLLAVLAAARTAGAQRVLFAPPRSRVCSSPWDSWKSGWCWVDGRRSSCSCGQFSGRSHRSGKSPGSMKRNANGKSSAKCSN